MTVNIIEGNTHYALIIVYGPNESEHTAVKDEFYEQLQKTTDETTQDNLIILGNLTAELEIKQNFGKG